LYFCSLVREPFTRLQARALRARNNARRKVREERVMRTRTIIGIVLLALISIGILLVAVSGDIYGVNPGWIVMGIVLAYAIFSVGTVRVDETAALFKFGKPIKDLDKGLYFAPVGIFSVEKEAGTVFQDELPADPEKIFREDGRVPEGMFPPIRVKFGQPDPADTALADDPYNVAMVAEVVPVVSWHITSLIEFRRVMGSIENCRKIMADKATEVFSDDFAQKTPAKAMLALDATSQRLEAKLAADTAGWGIVINDAYVKPIVFSHPLNTAVVNVSIAREGAKAAVLEANGKGQAVERAADAEKARLIRTGLAKVDPATGNIIELVPDANTRVNAEAVKELAKLSGTLVLGRDVTPVINVQKGEK